MSSACHVTSRPARSLVGTSPFLLFPLIKSLSIIIAISTIQCEKEHIREDSRHMHREREPSSVSTDTEFNKEYNLDKWLQIILKYVCTYATVYVCLCLCVCQSECAGEYL